jgi:hypothetical protein
MRKFFYIVVISAALAASACQPGPGGGGPPLGVRALQGSPLTASPTPTPTTAAAAPCRPVSLTIYDDVSKSINADVSRQVKENFIKGLESQHVPCAVSIRLVRFGEGSVWNTTAKRFDLPAPPPCGEPDYNKLPATVRNLSAWREKLREENARQCADKDSTFKKSYANALAALRAALLSDAGGGAPNGCTSFANVIERISADAQKASEETRFVVISDLKWDCNEYEPAPLYEKGVLIQLADARTDDKIKVSPLEESKRLKRLFPKAVVMQGVYAEEVASSLKDDLETPAR